MEKTDESQYLSLNGDQVASVCQLVGVQVGRETEGYQLHYSGKVITMSVWMKQAVSLEKFIREQRREFTSDLTITQVRPAVRREVTVLVTGLPFNTPDLQVTEYIESFGAKIVGGEPVY